MIGKCFFPFVDKRQHGNVSVDQILDSLADERVESPVISAGTNDNTKPRIKLMQTRLVAMALLSELFFFGFLLFEFRKARADVLDFLS